MSGAAGLLRAAQQLQQRAERRRGAEAVGLYQQAVVRASFRRQGPLAAAAASCHPFPAECPSMPFSIQGARLGTFLPPILQVKYQEAISAAGGDDPDALFGLAESLQGGAEATLAACAALPDEVLTAAAAQQADLQAAAALQESVAAYQRVLEGGQPRVDALVCAGNALRWGLPSTVLRAAPPALRIGGPAGWEISMRILSPAASAEAEPFFPPAAAPGPRCVPAGISPRRCSC